MKQFKSRFLQVTVFVCLLVISVACKQKNNKAVSNELPVYIENIFPEKGLTDPHNIIVDGKLYVFCGHDKSWYTESSWMMDRWEIHSTTNLQDWTKEGEILPTDTYIGDQPNCWAGDIVERNGKYYWYFSNRNINTGVMVADYPQGPFKDALGKPLLPKNIIKGHPYDPEIYEENGVYTLFFGSGHYWAVTLNKDMISLKDEPKKIKVVDKEGNDKWTQDKSTVFKNKDYYYLVWGGNYAMSKNLYGPYIYQGDFVKGGHNSVFTWKNNWYALVENKDIGLFYRGISLKSFGFNKDGTIKLIPNDHDYPGNGRAWNFTNSTMGWTTSNQVPAKWNPEGSIQINLESETAVESVLWAVTEIKNNSLLKIKFKNNSAAKKVYVYIATFDPKKRNKGKRTFWEETQIDWEKETLVTIKVKPNCNDFQHFNIDLSSYEIKNPLLKKVKIMLESDIDTGSLEIDAIEIKTKK